jgi:hypothetical protein
MFGILSATPFPDAVAQTPTSAVAGQSPEPSAVGASSQRSVTATAGYQTDAGAPLNASVADRPPEPKSMQPPHDREDVESSSVENIGLPSPRAIGVVQGDETFRGDAPSAPLRHRLATEVINAPSVLVSEQDQALHVIAASFVLDPRAELVWRQAAESTAAQFGKRLGAVSLNGKALGPAASGDRRNQS